MIFASTDVKFVLLTILQWKISFSSFFGGRRKGEEGRIYIGASGSMALGPEVPGGPFESKTKSGKYVLLLLKMPQPQTGPMGIKAMLLAHHQGPPPHLGSPC